MQPPHPQAAKPLPEPGLLRRHVTRSKPQCVGALWPYHAESVLGTQPRLLAKLLLQRRHQQVNTKEQKKPQNTSWLYHVSIPLRLKYHLDLSPNQDFVSSTK